MVGVNTFSGVDYTGSLFVDTQEDEDRDYVGFVFSYQVCNYIIVLSFYIRFILFLKKILLYSLNVLHYVSEQQTFLRRDVEGIWLERR